MSMPDYQAQFHNAMWVCLASGTAMSPFWWSYSRALNDNIVTDQLLSNRRFTERIPFAELTGLTPLEATIPGGDAYVMGSDQLIFGWAADADSDISGKSITIRGIENVQYRLRLYHPWRGRFLDEFSVITVGRNSLNIQVPVLKIEGGHARYIGKDVAFMLVTAE